MKKGGRGTMNNDWTNDIRQLMDGYEVKAPDGLLDEVKKSLAATRNEQSVVVSSQQEQPSVASSHSEKDSRNKAKVTPLWRYRWAAAAAIAVIAVPIFWKLMSDRQDQTSIDGRATSGIASTNRKSASSSAHASVTPAAASSVVPASSSYASEGSTVVAQASSIGTPLGTQASSGVSPVGTQASSGVSPVGTQASSGVSPLGEDGSVCRNSVAAHQPSATATTPRSKRLSKNQPHSSAPLDSYDLAYEPSTRSYGGFSVGAYYGGAVGSNGSGQAMPFIASDAVPYGTYPADMAVGYLKEAGPKRKAHHKQPIKAGVSVSYKINNRWSVQSGVTYSYLSSDFTSEVEPKETQKLHYVGIPMTGSYNIVSSKKAEVYVTAGGEVEKLVKGKMTNEQGENRDVKEHRAQWSVKAAVGGAYHFTPTLSVYVEPGVSHHFDNHSDVENIYKEKPTNFSLNMGFRVNLNNK